MEEKFFLWQVQILLELFIFCRLIWGESTQAFTEVFFGFFRFHNSVNFFEVWNCIEHIAVFIELLISDFPAQFVSFFDGGVLGIEGKKLRSLFIQIFKNSLIIKRKAIWIWLNFWLSFDFLMFHIAYNFYQNFLFLPIFCFFGNYVGEKIQVLKKLSFVLFI